MKPKTHVSTMPRLSQAERDRAIGMVQAGRSSRAVARVFGVHCCTITRLVERYNTTGLSNDRPRTGRPRVTTAAQDRYNRLAHLRDRFRPATRTAAETIGTHHRPVSARTIRNRLRADNIRPRRPYVGSVLTPRHRRARVEWCNAHHRWTLQRWSQVVFSDEKKFQCFRADGRDRVYRRPGERFAEACVRQVNRWGGPSVMVWAAISANHRSELVFIQGNLNGLRYRDEILRPVVLPFLEQVGAGALFQHDNARPHVARVCANFLEENDVHVLPWPALSPDLNPIENVWDLLSLRIRRREHPPETQQQLRAALVEEWAAIPQDQLRRYCRSMRRRIGTVLDVNGGHVNY